MLPQAMLCYAWNGVMCPPTAVADGVMIASVEDSRVAFPVISTAIDVPLVLLCSGSRRSARRFEQTAVSSLTESSETTLTSMLAGMG